MSIRTVIDLSPLSETTMPWRTLAALASRSAGGVPVPASLLGLRARRARLRRSAAFALRRLGALRRRAPRALSCGPASCGRRERCSRRRSFQGRSSSGSGSGVSAAAPRHRRRRLLGRSSSAAASSAARRLLAREPPRRGSLGGGSRSQPADVLLGDRTRGLASSSWGSSSSRLFSSRRRSYPPQSLSRHRCRARVATVSSRAMSRFAGAEPRRCSRARRSRAGSAG